MSKLQTDVHSLNTHEDSGVLVGIWSNKTFYKVREKLVQEGMEVAGAQQLTEDVVVAHIRHSMKIMRVWNNVVKEWLNPVTAEEEEVVSKLRTGIIEPGKVVGFDRIVMAWEGEWGKNLNNMGSKIVPTCAEEIVLDEMEKVQGVKAGEIWLGRAIWTQDELRRWKARVKVVEGYLDKPVVLARKLLYYRGQLKKEWAGVLDGRGEWEELLQRVEDVETDRLGSKWGRLVAMAINSHPDGIEEGQETFKRGKRKFAGGGEMDTMVKKAKLRMGEVSQEKKRKREEGTTPYPSRGRPGPLGSDGPAP